MRRLFRIIRYLIRRKRFWFASVCLGTLLVMAGGAYTVVELIESGPQPQFRTWSEIVASDTLRVVTVRGSISAFRYKDNWMGYEYEMAFNAAHQLNLQLEVMMVKSEKAMLDSLYAGAADVAIWPMAGEVMRADGNVRRGGYAYEMPLVMLSSRKIRISDKDSARYKMPVIEGSRAWHYLALRDTVVVPLVDTMAIHGKRSFVKPVFELRPWALDTIASDSMDVEALAERVASGDCDAILLDENIAALMKGCHPTLQMGKPLDRSTDTLSWAVSILADTLAAKLDSVTNYRRGLPKYSTKMRQNYVRSLQRVASNPKLKGGGHLSDFDGIFRSTAREVNWDWRMIAAVAYAESRFKEKLVSARGARGLMQLMPNTAERFGCPVEKADDPETNIRSGARLLEYLRIALRNRVMRCKYDTLSGFDAADSIQRADIEQNLMKLTLAAYNSGLGHIFDAIMLADTLGFDPAVWDGNVAHCLRLKGEPEYYKMECVHSGKFSAGVTISYVREVEEYYEDFCERVAPDTIPQPKTAANKKKKTTKQQ